MNSQYSSHFKHRKDGGEWEGTDVKTYFKANPCSFHVVLIFILVRDCFTLFIPHSLEDEYKFLGCF